MWEIATFAVRPDIDMSRAGFGQARLARQDFDVTTCNIARVMGRQ